MCPAHPRFPHIRCDADSRAYRVYTAYTARRWLERQHAASPAPPCTSGGSRQRAKGTTRQCNMQHATVADRAGCCMRGPPSHASSTGGEAYSDAPEPHSANPRAAHVRACSRARSRARSRAYGTHACKLSRTSRARLRTLGRTLSRTALTHVHAFGTLTAGSVAHRLPPAS